MKGLRLISTLAAVILLSAVQSYSQTLKTTVPANQDSALVDAVNCMDNGNIKDAFTALKKIVEANPENDAAQFYLGTCYLYMRDLPNAQAALKKASTIDPSNFWYKDRLATAYSMAGEDDLTIATYEELLKEYPKKNDLYYSLVNLYFKQGQFDKALASLDQIESVFGKSEAVTSTRYDILLRLNKTDEALKALQDYNAEFSSPRILSQIGDHSMAEYKDSLALECYQEALDIQSNYAPALLGKAEVYRTRRNYPDFFSSLNQFVSDEDTPAAGKLQYLNMLVGRSEPRFVRSYIPQIDSLFDKVVECSPTDSAALASSAMFSFSTGDMDKAKRMIVKNMEAHPDNKGCAVTYLQILGSFEDWDGILSAADTALLRFPDATEFLELKNYACYNKNDYRGIIENSKRIIEVAQGDTSKTIPALANIGDMYHQLGDEKQAFSTYKQVLKQNPDYIPTLNNYAYYLSVKGKSLKKALAMSKKTIEKEPDNPTYLDTIGWILHLMGKDQEAKTYFKHAMLYGGKESATCLSHYATVLDALGETDLAKVYRSQAQKREEEGKE